MSTLPIGWIEAALGDLTSISRGASPRPKGDPRYFGGNIPWISIADVTKQEGRYLTSTRESVTEAGARLSRYLAAGSLILTNSATICVPKILGVSGCIHDGFLHIEYNSECIDGYWLYEYFNSVRDSVRQTIKQGVTQVNLNTEIVSKFQVKLPPLPEQRRIVAKIDALAARSKRARADLDRVEALAARAKQAVLASQFTGQVPVQPLGEAVEFVTSGSRGWARYYSESGSVFVRVGNVRRGDINLDLEDAQHVQPPSGAEGIRTRVRRGDILVTITADLGRVGVVADDNLNAYVNQHVALIRPLEAHRSRFIAWYLSSPHGQQQLFAGDRGVTRAGLGLDDIRRVRVPRLSQRDEERLVASLEAQLGTLGRILQEAHLAARLLPRIDQAILSKAFRGELVPQHPADEPASILLDRIFAERVAAGQAPKRRGRRSKVNA